MTAMNELKEGDLVKAWDDDPSEYTIGEFVVVDDYDSDMPIEIFIGSMDCSEWFKNATKIPNELAKQLEELK